ncbi:MAG: hypothetical protein EOP49_07230 [Sphingobacteriales bacterium]|nr:MAG: hypothetical protein EOP49_07230 [Sphingobacteriales bacterium]
MAAIIGIDEQNASPATSALVQRLQPYLHSDAVWTRYQAQKARMWLVYADSERSQRGITNAAAQAEAEAVKLLEQLEQNQAISPTTPIIASSKVLRRDLWATAELLKQQAGFDCAADDLAHAEVTLVWAAAEHCELGWRHSRELFASAERLVDEAHYQANRCHGASATAIPLARVSYPSLAELNGTQKGCHGVVGQWPIIASTAESMAAVATVPAEVATSALGSAVAVDTVLDSAPMNSVAVNPVAVNSVALNVPDQVQVNDPVQIQPQTQSQLQEQSQQQSQQQQQAESPALVNAAAVAGSAQTTEAAQ